MKALVITFLTSILSSFLKNKNIDEEILEELIKGMKELIIEISALKKDIRLSTL